MRQQVYELHTLLEKASVKPPYVMAGLVALGALLLYIVTLAPTTQFWDTSEYIAAAYVLGIPHPPGNPLFVMLAHVWGLFPWAAAYAVRINLFAAATSAVAAGCWFLIGERWLQPIVPAKWPRRLAALAGAIVSATAFTVWNQSVVNERSTRSVCARSRWCSGSSCGGAIRRAQIGVTIICW
jgi:hypothetical protein